MTAIAAFTTAPTSQVPNATGGSTGMAAGVATGFEALLALTGLPTTDGAPAPDAAVLGAESLKASLDPLAGQAEAAAQAAAGLVAAMSPQQAPSFMAPPVADPAEPPPAFAALAATASTTNLFTPLGAPPLEGDQALSVAQAAVPQGQTSLPAAAPVTTLPADSADAAVAAPPLAPPVPASTPAAAPAASVVAQLALQPEVVSVVGVMAAPGPADAAAPTADSTAPVVAQLAAKPAEFRAAPPTRAPDAKVEAALAPLHQAVQAVEADGTADPGAGDDANTGGKTQVLVAEAPVAAESASVDAVAFTPVQPATAPAAAPTSTPLAAVQATPETVAHLSAEIARKTDGKSTRFDIVLTPEGLGRVDVRVEIAADGQLSASLAFDNPQAANDLRNRAGDLRQALANAGFDVADNALKFDLSSSGGQGGQGGAFDFHNGENGRRAFSGRAFQGAVTEDLPPLTAADLPPGLRMAAASGLDVRI